MRAQSDTVRMVEYKILQMTATTCFVATPKTVIQLTSSALASLKCGSSFCFGAAVNRPKMRLMMPM